MAELSIGLEFTQMKGEMLNYRKLYKLAYSFLLSCDGVTPKLIKLHLEPEFSKPKDLRTIYYRLCWTAQNKQMSTKVIGNSIGGVDNLKIVLFDFDPYEVSKKYSKIDALILLDEIIDALNPKGQIRRTSRSIWPLFCQSIIDSAHFLSAYDNAESFYKWADFFANDIKAKPALPMMISLEIAGIGFPLACDFLKEIGYINYGKPDVHLKEIFKALGLINQSGNSTLKEDYQTLQLIDRIAADNKVSAFEVDKIFWLIGSGNFYKSNLKIGRKRKEFVEMTLNDP